jgi:hypothetical protein
MFYLIRPKLGMSPLFRFACGESESPRDVKQIQWRPEPSSGAMPPVQLVGTISVLESLPIDARKITDTVLILYITDHASYARALYGESDKDDRSWPEYIWQPHAPWRAAAYHGILDMMN